MTPEKTTKAFGWRVYGLGVMAIGLACVAFGNFDPGQPVPQAIPARAALAYAAGVLMIAAAAAIQWRRTTAWGAAALTAYYALIVVLLLNGRLLLAHYAEYGTYENLAEQLGIALGGLIIYAATANMDTALSARLTRFAQLAFGACVLVWGGAHFVYMNLTAPLVPKWLPPTQVFWGYATGTGFIAAGIAILTGIQARLAAVVLTAMLASFTLLVHVRLLIADPSAAFNWTELAENLAILGATWVVADSLSERRPPRDGSS